MVKKLAAPQQQQQQLKFSEYFSWSNSGISFYPEYIIGLFE